MRNAILTVAAVCGFAGPVAAQDMAAAVAAKSAAATAEADAATKGIAAAEGRDNANSLYYPVVGKWANGGYEKKMPMMVYMQTASYISSGNAHETAGRAWLNDGNDAWGVGVTETKAGLAAFAQGDWATAVAKFNVATGAYTIAASDYGNSIQHYNSACAARLCADALMAQYP